jgi:hypothetical protein
MLWGRFVVLLAVGAMGVAAACTNPESSAPFGKGDHLYVDVEASTLPPQPDVYLPPDSTFAEVEGSTLNYGPGYDAAVVFAVCDPPDGSASAGEAGAEGGSAGACEPFPAACASQPTCECLLGLASIATQLPCSYPHCSAGSVFSLYCPP